MTSVHRNGQDFSRPEKAPDILIDGGILITMVEDEEPISDARVFIDDGRITRIQRVEEERDKSCSPREVIDARDCLVMPGLINGHTHAAMSLFRGIADDLPLREWLFEKIFPAESRFLNPDTVYWGSLLACLEMISSGTTCFADGYFFQDGTVRAVKESGLRALIGQGVIDFPAPGVEDPKENIAAARRFIEDWQGFSGLITPDVFCHSPITCSERTLRAATELSQEFNLPLQIHLSETREEVTEIMKRAGVRPVHYLDGLGVINSSLIAVHAVHLDHGEMECLREKGVRIVHCPESSMKLGSGTARVSNMLKMGLTVGLGTDGCSSNNNLDLFQEMDIAAKLSKVTEQDPGSLDARTALRMSTRWGAAVLGLEKEIGTIEEGKKADIIVVDLNSPHLCPLYNPYSAMVYAADGADVKDVIVNGKVLMKDRKHITLDPQEIMKRVKGISRNIRL
ncbi:MAG: amidohydrolase [Pseudomonadota bacterium]